MVLQVSIFWWKKALCPKRFSEVRSFSVFDKWEVFTFGIFVGWRRDHRWSAVWGDEIWWVNLWKLCKEYIEQNTKRQLVTVSQLLLKLNSVCGAKKVRNCIERSKFQPFSFALQTQIFQSNLFILVPTLNLIKPLNTCSASLSGLACAPASLPLFCIPSSLRLSDTQAWSSQQSSSPGWAPLGIIDSQLRLASVPGDSKGFAEVGTLCSTQHSPFIHQQSSSERCLPCLRLVFGLLG